MGPHEPYWQTNTSFSFSPPPSRWDFRFQSEGLPYSLLDGTQVYRSSTSSSGDRGSQGWARSSRLNGSLQSASDGTGLFLSSPSDHSQDPYWTPPRIQEISIDDLETEAKRDSVMRQILLGPNMEGTSALPNSRDSISFRSDNSESETAVKSHRNFSNRRHFMSKPIHPLTIHTFVHGEPSESMAAGFADIDAASPQRDAHRWSSASSSIDFVDISEAFESGVPDRQLVPYNGFKCGLCETFLSQRSPMSSYRGDLPVSGVLSCRHVYHVDCLEQITPKTLRSDPPCPLCAKPEEENSPEQQAFVRSRNSFPKLRPLSEDGSSRTWDCMQVGDCVEGALHASPRNSMLRNRNRFKNNLSFKANSNKEFPGKLRKSTSHSFQLSSGKSVDQEIVGCSNP